MSGPEVERHAAELVKLLRSKAPHHFVEDIMADVGEDADVGAIAAAFDRRDQTGESPAIQERARQLLAMLTAP